MIDIAEGVWVIERIKSRIAVVDAIVAVSAVFRTPQAAFKGNTTGL